ncbi:heme-degrading monooxygenase IsdG [Acinetobacter sp. SFD]|uniref:heme oxygenase n=1 Tax=Acinetobacter sp. SFD TaxID=1805635 RepID=UPI0007D049A8|nr:heme oxygenase [Acinetobacter sp. SFD]OAL84245.1 heme-degrading monooxygenase IsdG [Acinetobacter sp. SFD]
MIVVTNRICVKKGMGKKMAPMFTKEGPLQSFDGFEKVEVLVSEHEDHDEMSVNMYWQSQEQFEVWRQSDAFKQAHHRPANGGPTAENNPVISSKLVISQVASTATKI